MQPENQKIEWIEPKSNTPGCNCIGRDLLILFLFSAMTITMYSHALESPFVFDDVGNILENPYIRITDLTFESLYNAAFKSLRPKRPVANISFALNYYIGQYHVVGYHIVNILIHIASGMVLYLFLKVTFTIQSPCLRHTRLVPFFASFIWLVHPVQTQAVTYIVQRMTSMSALFYVVTMLFYVQARIRYREERLKKIGKRFFQVYLYVFGAVFSGIMALSSKENAATLPFFLVLYEWFFFQNLDRKWLKRNGVHFIWIFSIFLLIAFIYVDGNPVEKILSQYDKRDFTLVQRLLTEFRVVIFYISLLAFPHPSRLNLEHDFSLSNSLIDPTATLLSVGCITGLVLIAILFARKERFLSFCILWFLGNLALESTFVGLEIIFEHRLYLPSMLALTIPVYACFRYVKPEVAAKISMCLLVVVCSIWTYQRNWVWKDEIALFTDCVQKSPNKARPHISLGNALLYAGSKDAATIILNKAVQLDPKSPFAQNSYGVALSMQGDIEHAIPHFEKAIRLLPIYIEAKQNLEKAFVYQQEERRIQAIHASIQLHPDSVDLYHEMGDLMQNREDLEKAIQWYEKALSIKPGQIDILKKLSVAYARKGEYDNAIALQQQILDQRPGDADACYMIASIHARKNQIRQSLQWLKQALDNGFDNWEQIQLDENLQNIRNTKAFRKIIGLRKTNQ